jgi:hypothetical protein
MSSIKDLIYFDLEKARSLISQLKGGLISEISRAFEDESETSSGIGFDLKLISGKTGASERERVVKTEKIELYHELLNEIESKLTEKSYLTNISSSFYEGKGSFNDFMEIVPSMTYIKATGWGQFEDFQRFKRILSNFNDVQRLIFESQVTSNPEIAQLREQLKDAKKDANQIKDKNAKSKEVIRLKHVEKNLDKALTMKTDITLLDESFIEKVKIFLDTFSPNRLNFRILPLDEFYEFQILSNLKEKYIIDGDFESIIYTYGSRPNIKLTVFGVITSCPPKEENRVNPNDEFILYNDSELTAEQIFDKAFRNVFSSFEAFEKFFFVPTYPKIAVTPIAIYREIQKK